MSNKKFFNLDILKFKSKKSKKNKRRKSGIEKKIDDDIDKTFTWKNIWKHLALFIFFIGIILRFIPFIHNIPLPFVGSVGDLGSTMFILSGLYLAYKHRKEVMLIFGMLKFFVMSLISFIFMFVGGGSYYSLRKKSVDKDIKTLLKMTGLPTKQGSDTQDISGNQSSSSSQTNDRELKQLKRQVSGLINMIPVNVLSELRKDYIKRLITFFVIYVISLNYFVIFKTYATTTKIGKFDKEQNESFWAGVRGFGFGLFIFFMLSFVILMKQKGKNINKTVKSIIEYSLIFSTVTGLSSALTKYLVNGPLKFIFKL